MNQSDIPIQLKAHQRWLHSNHIDGEQLVLNDKRWTGVKLADANLCDAVFSGCEFVECTLNHCDFSNVKLLSVRFLNCRFLNCKFVNSDMRGAMAELCDFAGSNFTRADLTDAVFASSDFSNCVLDWSWLVRTDLRFAVLTGIRLENARLMHTKLYNDKSFQFSLPSVVKVQELDFSPEGDGSMRVGAEGLGRLLIEKSE